MDGATAEALSTGKRALPIGRLSHLDALRGIAAVLVMIQHSVTIIARHPHAAGWYQAFARACNTLYFSPGRAGVVAFFLISGFVIPFSLKAPRALTAFAISRFFRLYPAYWLSLLLAITLLPALEIRTFPIKQVLANVTMLQFGLGQPNVIGAYWTLFIEMAFYFLCAAWFLLGSLRSARFISIAAVSLVGLAFVTAFVRYYHPSAPIPVGYVNFLAAMHVGTLARLATLERDKVARRALPYVVALALVSTIGISWLAYSKTPEVDSWISGITGLYAGYAIFFFTIWRRAFVNAFTLYLGKISYSYYLLHGLMLSVGSSIGYTLDWPMGTLVIAVFVMGVAPILATIIFTFVEMPSVALGHKIMKRVRREAGVTPTLTKRPL